MDDPCHFQKFEHNQKQIQVTIHVDDIETVATIKDLMWFISILKKRFGDVKVTMEPKFQYLGMVVEPKPKVGLISISIAHYIKNLLSFANVTSKSTRATPCPFASSPKNS